MDGHIHDIDVVSELNRLSGENKYKEIVNLLRENLYQFNNDPNKLVSVLTIRIYYNLHLKNFNDVDSDFELIESIFKDKLDLQFPYTGGSSCPFSTFLLHAYYPHLKGLSYLSLDRLNSLLQKLREEANYRKPKGYGKQAETQQPERENDEEEDSGVELDDYESDLLSQTLVKRIMKTVLFISDVLITVMRPLEAIKLLTKVNLKYDENDLSTNLLLSIIYKKLGRAEESERYMEVFANSDNEHEHVYKGILKVYDKDYEGAIENLKAFKLLGSFDDSEGYLKDHERVLVNNLAVTTLYAQRSQEAANIFFKFGANKEGLQAQRGISSNADVLKELSIYH